MVNYSELLILDGLSTVQCSDIEMIDRSAQLRFNCPGNKDIQYSRYSK
jgi:hypothetical protein